MEWLGRRVAFWAPRTSGTYADYAVAPAAVLFPLTETLDFRVGAALPPKASPLTDSLILLPLWLRTGPLERWIPARRDLLRWVAEGTLHVTVGHTFPLHHAAEAHRQLEQRQTRGRLVLLPAV